jgi:hypothetical protein
MKLLLAFLALSTVAIAASPYPLLAISTFLLALAVLLHILTYGGKEASYDEPPPHSQSEVWRGEE